MNIASTEAALRWFSAALVTLLGPVPALPVAALVGGLVVLWVSVPILRAARLDPSARLLLAAALFSSALPYAWDVTALAGTLALGGAVRLAPRLPLATMLQAVARAGAAGATALASAPSGTRHVVAVPARRQVSASVASAR